MTYLLEIYNYSCIFPLNNEIGVDFYCKVSVVYFENFEVVKPNGNIHRIRLGGIQWWNISKTKISLKANQTDILNFYSNSKVLFDHKKRKLLKSILTQSSLTESSSNQ